MNQIVNKIKTKLLNSIAIIIVLFSLCIDLVPNLYFNTSAKLFMYCLAIILIFINMKIKNSKIKDDYKKEKNRKEFMIKILIIYSVLLITLLFIDGNYRRFGFSVSKSITLFSKEHFECYSNFVPFKTICSFVQRMNTGTINISIVLTNIIGNIIAFAPFGIFFPTIFKEKFKDIKKFTLLMVIIVFLVECIQFITLNGSFDIDDIILNVLGAIIMFCIMKIKIINNQLEKILE